MNTDTSEPVRILGTLRAADGKGIVRLEERFDTDINDLWSALTEPARLARWLGTVEGDLRHGGEFSAHYFASGWEGTCHIEDCQPPRRLQLATKSLDGPDGIIEAILIPDGDHTILGIEDRGLPLEQIAAYGAGNQVHVEDLTAYLAGRGRCDARVRWQELHPAYQELATKLT
ncbi:hypothetical protein CVO76_15135 [Arthrobacter agilis]|uniref:Activator of Hsp90 ATPase homologue 1/2-like C-terminal domain-containing protein n=1 Tax=Arthrobacter agilis TaxID=37921 RepID=A0A2L0UHW5_9MICC|nr:SRPBCC domain-containing protein [Arthrobacter agilis]AUZ88829.1 hypothetical protein CVO76_15135 [Arthrobacter agilis]